ncbi:MAG: peptidoglycan-binding protein [Granulosicoccus sp.]|nr:peptidoglycan-binding protein [Granulosicoccus sp.]
MRKLTLPLLGVLGSCLIILPVTAQQVDNNLVLPDAKPGECYAKVITPARFETRSEEIIVQEASERIETVEATYESADQTIIVKDAGQAIEVTPTVFSKETDKVEVRPAELTWTTRVGSRVMPASPDAIEHISRSGIDTKSVDPGSCFAEYYTEAQYKSETVQVMVKEATQTISVVPAEYETVEERVVVKEASSEVVDVPAVYRTETESVLVEPARSVWQENCGVIERVDNATGEVMCLVEVPARYETLTKTVQDKPATTKTINIPAVYKTIKVQRLVRPASEKRVDVPAEYTSVNRRVKVADPVFFWLAKGETADSNAVATGREICLTQRPAEYANITREVVSEPASTKNSVIPARYQTITVQRLVSPASERRITIPARTKTVTSQIELSPAQAEWKQVLCEANMTRQIVTSLQRALKREGFDPGPIDGIMGRGTLKAIADYQTAEGIDKGGITLQLLRRLKVQS